jgi:hypothetical protein
MDDQQNMYEKTAITKNATEMINKDRSQYWQWLSSHICRSTNALDKMINKDSLPNWR